MRPRPGAASQIVVSARSRPRGRPRTAEPPEPSLAPQVRITDACGTLVAVYDPLYLRRFRPGTEPSAARRERAARRLVPATVRILAGLA